MRILIILLLIGIFGANKNTLAQGKCMCYILSGYIFDLNNPDYVVVGERIIIDKDTIYSDSVGHYQYIVSYNAIRDINLIKFKDYIGLITNKHQLPNKKKIIIRVKGQDYSVKNDWKKMEKNSSLRVKEFNIGINWYIDENSRNIGLMLPNIRTVIEQK